MNLQDMIAKRTQAAKRKSEIAEAALTADRDLTPEEQTEFDNLDTEVKKLAKQIELRQSCDNDTQYIPDTPKPKSQPETPKMEYAHPALVDDPYAGYGNRNAIEDFQRRGKEVPHKMWSHWFGTYACDVAAACRDRNSTSPRLRNWQTAYLAAGDGMAINPGFDGGYLVPTAFGSLIDTIALEAAVIRPRAAVIPMNALRISFPCVDDTSHSSDTVFGGVACYFKSEEAQLTSSKPKFSEVSLELHKLTALAYATNEMIDWSPISVGSWLPMKLAQAIVWKEEDKFISGSGAAGEPLGLLNADCGIAISAEAGQAAATIIFENIVKMDARAWTGGNRSSLVWIANQTCKTQLPKLGYIDGTSATPIFLPANGAAGRPLETLYGYPIMYTEHCEALGTVGDICLVNLSQYYIGDATGKMRTDRDMGLKFDYDQTAFRVVTYTGGTPAWRSAFTPQHGDSLSPIIRLATRS